MIIDIFSRKVVGWEVHDSESGEHAAQLLERTLWSEKCVKKDVVLHSDNGSPMKCLTMQAKMLHMVSLALEAAQVSAKIIRTQNHCSARSNTVTAGQAKALKALKMQELG